jgi:type I restriction-modification system DNA methylase subunit
MSNPAPQLVQKLWNYCNILRDDGLSYGDYVEQLTFLLFLKMAEVERRLSVVEELESAVTANLQRATRLRQSILQKAFRGELPG